MGNDLHHNNAVAPSAKHQQSSSATEENHVVRLPGVVPDTLDKSKKKEPQRPAPERGQEPKPGQTSKQTPKPKASKISRTPGSDDSAIAPADSAALAEKAKKLAAVEAEKTDARADSYLKNLKGDPNTREIKIPLSGVAGQSQAVKGDQREVFTTLNRLASDYEFKYDSSAKKLSVYRKVEGGATLAGSIDWDVGRTNRDGADTDRLRVKRDILNLVSEDAKSQIRAGKFNPPSGADSASVANPVDPAKSKGTVISVPARPDSTSAKTDSTAKGSNNTAVKIGDALTGGKVTAVRVLGGLLKRGRDAATNSSPASEIGSDSVETKVPSLKVDSTRVDGSVTGVSITEIGNRAFNNRTHGDIGTQLTRFEMLKAQYDKDYGPNTLVANFNAERGEISFSVNTANFDRKHKDRKNGAPLPTPSLLNIGGTISLSNESTSPTRNIEVTQVSKAFELSGAIDLVSSKAYDLKSIQEGKKK